ncbi:MAG TPA: pitrilysin family protein, partial [Candidatus Limnocylindrales bacterium]|nr:pitrilysin family protein [Candidatus Limnocylindrales bacterium]
PPDLLGGHGQVAVELAVDQVGVVEQRRVHRQPVGALLDPHERAELLAEVVQLPSFPAAEVDRLRDERLNDILQARADPRRRADEAFVERIYTPDSPYHRPAAGLPETVAPLGSRHLREAYEDGLDPARSVLVVGGDLSGLDVPALADRLFGTWRGSERAGPARPIVARSAVRERVVHVVHRPGAVQTEVRVGHVGLPRRIPDFHALSLMSAILGGLFNSRLNMKLREERGYTYGAGASFDLRRGPGPFSARAAVHTAATVPAVLDILVELERMRDAPVGEDELRAARDFLVGVFPLRFETPGPVVAALSGLFVHELPDDELRRYRGAIEAVTIDDVLQAARTRLRLEELAIVLVGDVDAFGAELEAARIGPVEVERDVGPRTEGPLEGVEEELGPVDEQEDVGPAPGAREPPDEADEEPADVDLGAEGLTGGPS